MVKKFNKKSPSTLEEKYFELQNLFPECFKENKIDFEKLRISLGDIVDTNDEKYSFRWAGRTNTFRNIQNVSSFTILPLKTESVDFDETKNIFIEGDNLEVLKLLQKTYFEKIKMIYIDPPYNTGNDFIYKDNFHNSVESYLEQTGQTKSGVKLTTNPETSGRFHSDWISFMYARLFVARNLLKDDGVMFVSIDDNEEHNLKMIMNEIFGVENFVATFIWEKRTTRENRRVFSFNHDFILCYAKNKDLFQASRNLLPLSDEVLSRYSNPDKDPRGDWQSVSLNAQAGHATPTQFYDITTPSGRILSPPPGRCWSVTKNRVDELIQDNRIWFGHDGNNVPRLKIFLSEADQGLTPHTLWTAKEVGTNDSAKKDLIELFSNKAVYDTPKPIELIKRMITISTSDDDLILDFFAGSGTTSHAVMELNKLDNGKRRCISVQIPELCDENSDACKSGYKTIADIGKDRMRKSIKKIKEDSKQQKLKNNMMPDLGFKVFKLSKSNFRIWESHDDKDQKKLKEQMKLFESPLISGYKDEDVIYECIIKEGFNLNSKIEPMNIKSNKVYKISDDAVSFYLCVDKLIKDDIIDKLNLTKDDTLICIDAALDDSKKTNLAKQCVLKTM